MQSGLGIDVDDPLWEEGFGALRGTKRSADSSSSCAHCGSGTVQLRDGFYECTKCSSLVDRMLDHGAEWRFYGGEDTRAVDPTRCGPPTSELLPMLGCVIGGGGGHSEASHSMRMIQKYHIWNVLTYRERSLCSVFSLLSVNASTFNIPVCILEEAKALYKQLSERRLTRGDNRSALIASSLYMSCKSNNVPRSIKEIAAMFNIKVSCMTKGCKMFQELVKLDVNSSAPGDFVGRFCSRVGMAPAATALCHHVVARADAMGLVCDTTPPSAVAGAMQLVSVELSLGLDKRCIGEACMISPVTICKCHKRLVPYREQLLPTDLGLFMAQHGVQRPTHARQCTVDGTPKAS